MIVERTFAWDYEIEGERAEEARKQVAMGAACVLTDHDWAHESFSLEVYRPVHRQENFEGGYYEEYDASEHFHVTESEAYALVAGYLKAGEPIRFFYDGRARRLMVYHFRQLGGRAHE